ncbi:hypothetical protein DPEC_G00213470 [Dallia pectoralis]|uniref:Uncharacterized protein n=1 Tax=Dallia pectoralis TaxID=75939 RepID=A0ACC2G664_DALPE|nr:hypothetical protein DPEC_G00213470 [Dallia pectoralis]
MFFSCFLALNSSAQAGQGLIEAQARKLAYKDCVWAGKEAPGQADRLFIGIQSPWTSIHTTSWTFTSLDYKKDTHFLEGVQKSESLTQPLPPHLAATFNG